MTPKAMGIFKGHDEGKVFAPSWSPLYNGKLVNVMVHSTLHMFLQPLHIQWLG